jgi:hypothetical protein
MGKDLKKTCTLDKINIFSGDLINLNKKYKVNFFYTQIYESDLAFIVTAEKSTFRNDALAT